MKTRTFLAKAMESHGAGTCRYAVRPVGLLALLAAVLAPAGCTSRDEGRLEDNKDRAATEASLNREAVEEFNLAVPHLNAREWEEALPHLERAKELGFATPEHESMGETALADAYLNLGRYEEAVAPARRARELGVSVDAQDPLPHLMLAKVLSYRWAKTEDVGLREEARDELRAFAEKAAASGMETVEIALKGEATQYRLETGRLITDVEYFDEMYSSGNPFGDAPEKE